MNELARRAIYGVTPRGLDARELANEAATPLPLCRLRYSWVRRLTPELSRAAKRRRLGRIVRWQPTAQRAATGEKRRSTLGPN